MSLSTNTNHLFKLQLCRLGLFFEPGRRKWHPSVCQATCFPTSAASRSALEIAIEVDLWRIGLLNRLKTWSLPLRKYMLGRLVEANCWVSWSSARSQFPIFIRRHNLSTVYRHQLDRLTRTINNEPNTFIQWFEFFRKTFPRFAAICTILMRKEF